MFKNKKISGALLAVACVTALLQACGDENPQPKDDVIPDLGGASSTGGKDSGSSTGGAENLGGDGGGGSDAGTGGTGGTLAEEPDREDCSEEPNGDDAKIGECWDRSPRRRSEKRFFAPRR